MQLRHRERSLKSTNIGYDDHVNLNQVVFTYVHGLIQQSLAFADRLHSSILEQIFIRNMGMRSESFVKGKDKN